MHSSKTVERLEGKLCKPTVGKVVFRALWPEAGHANS